MANGTIDLSAGSARIRQMIQSVEADERTARKALARAVSSIDAEHGSAREIRFAESQIARYRRMIEVCARELYELHRRLARLDY